MNSAKARSEWMKAKKIWEKSTGPKTDEGKDRASLNAWKNGDHSANTLDLRKALREHEHFLRDLRTAIRFEDLKKSLPSLSPELSPPK